LLPPATTYRVHVGSMAEAVVIEEIGVEMDESLS
jgi:hypothetical protein